MTISKEDEEIIRRKWERRDSKVSFYEVGELLREIDSLRDLVHGLYNPFLHQGSRIGIAAQETITRIKNERTKDNLNSHRKPGGI